MGLITCLVCDLCVTCPDPLRSIGYYNNGTEIKDRRDWLEETFQVRTRASRKAFELWWRPDPQERNKLEGLLGKLLSRSKRSLAGGPSQSSSSRNPTSHTPRWSCICYSHWLGSMKGIMVAWILHQCRVGGSICYYVPCPTKHNWKPNPQYFPSYPRQTQLYITCHVLYCRFLLCFSLPLCWCICYRINQFILLLVIINLLSFIGCEALKACFPTFNILVNFSVVSNRTNAEMF